jgi:anti-anti-sigma factor
VAHGRGDEIRRVGQVFGRSPGIATVMLALTETRREVGSSVFRLIQVHGECGLLDVDRLEAAALDVPIEEDDGVVIGLEHCEFIDSMALAALLRAYNRFADDGRRLVLAAPTVQARRVLQVSGLNIGALVFDSVEQAFPG